MHFQHQTYGLESHLRESLEPLIPFLQKKTSEIWWFLLQKLWISIHRPIVPALWIKIHVRRLWSTNIYTFFIFPYLTHPDHMCAMSVTPLIQKSVSTIMLKIHSLTGRHSIDYRFNLFTVDYFTISFLFLLRHFFFSLPFCSCRRFYHIPHCNANQFRKVTSPTTIHEWNEF